MDKPVDIQEYRAPVERTGIIFHKQEYKPNDAVHTLPRRGNDSHSSRGKVAVLKVQETRIKACASMVTRTKPSM
jgi:hypothetical protein